MEHDAVFFYSTPQGQLKITDEVSSSRYSSKQIGP